MSKNSDLCAIAYARYPELTCHGIDCSGTYILYSANIFTPIDKWKAFKKNGFYVSVESLKHPEMTVDPPNTASNPIPSTTAGAAYSSTSGSWGTETCWAGINESEYITSITDLDRYTQTLKEKKMSVQKRLVKIFVVDPNENVPLEDSIMWQKECLTDESDVELLQQIGMVEILARHNAKRTAVLDKTRSIAAEKDIYLEPAKLRDVVSRVITVVVF